jgi:hypothetical protein
MHDHDIVAGEPPPKRDRGGMANRGQPPPDISVDVLNHVARTALAAIGAFLGGVFPGAILVSQIVIASRVFLGVGEIIVLHLLFASLGSFGGIAFCRLTSWSKPSATDVVLILANGLLFGLIGFAFLVYLTPGT